MSMLRSRRGRIKRYPLTRAVKVECRLSRIHIRIEEKEPYAKRQKGKQRPADKAQMQAEQSALVPRHEALALVNSLTYAHLRVLRHKVRRQRVAIGGYYAGTIRSSDHRNMNSRMNSLSPTAFQKILKRENSTLNCGFSLLQS